MEESLLNNKNSQINIDEEDKNSENNQELEEDGKVERMVKRWGYRDRDPYKNSNIFSRLFFYWAFKIIRLANLTTLKNEYLGKLEGDNRSQAFTKYIKYLWYEKNYKNLKKFPLLKTTLRANCCNLFLIIILNLIITGFTFVSLYLFRIYILTFNEDYKPKWEYFSKFNVGIAFLAVKVLMSLIKRQSSMLQNILGTKIGIELNSLIFDKVLKASPAGFKDKSDQGQIINFLQVDSIKISVFMTYCTFLITIPILIGLYIYMLFELIGLTFLFGVGALLFFLGINFFIQTKNVTLNTELLKKKDERMSVTREVFNHLKILKLYAWEDEFMNRILKSREEEMGILRKIFRYSNINLSLLWFSPTAVSIITIGAYQYFVETLKIEDIFTLITIFNNMADPIRDLPWIINSLIEVLISMGRIEKFLSQDEVDPSNVNQNDLQSIINDISIKMENGNFTWGENNTENDIKFFKKKKKKASKNQISIEIKENKKSGEEKLDDSQTHLISNSRKKNSNLDPSQFSQVSNISSNVPLVLKNLNFEIKKGEFIFIIGEVGSGKSSFLQAILNNMLPVNINNKDPSILVNGSVGYVSQEPWIQNETLKNNIIFHNKYDESKYNNVLNICELRTDLDVLIGGDMTEIGEKGINLSGGQKARINLARAIYTDKEIFLIDDPISSLDALVGQRIVRNCFVNYLKNKTRILVTNALQYLNFADKILYFNNGNIEWSGTFHEIKYQDFFLDFKLRKSSLNNSQSSAEKNDISKVNDDDKVKKKEIARIIKEEQKQEGNVKMNVYLKYNKYMGGFCVFFSLIIIMILWQALKGSADLWLTYWTQIQTKDSDLYNYGIYSALAGASAIFIFLRTLILTQSTLGCAKSLHEDMIVKLIKAPINLYHDSVPKGQILNRLSKDITLVDSFLPFLYGGILANFFSFIGVITICSLKETYSLLFLPFLFIIGWMTSRFYLSASRDLGRIEGLVRSPIINLLSEALPGAITIRAYKYENIYIDKFLNLCNDNMNVRKINAGCEQWFGLIFDFLSISFTVFLISFTVVYEDKFKVQDIGILLTYSLHLQDNLFYLLNEIAGFENCLVGVERCLEYTTINTELPYEKSTDIDLKEWPRLGAIKFIDYSVRYRPETELVLKNLNFEIKSGEKVGVVGRTASGKSTLCLALFRILEPSSGTIFIDDVDICTIGLKKLRSSLTIIPQEPNLMEGTLIYNIDPLGLYTTDVIKEVMEMIGFWYICENNSKGLEQKISENGDNLSVGEKQLICITRAILRKSKIVIMDEATANIDLKTEEIIQQSINLILKNSTVITIAHRIKTILHYDKILVLNNGEIAEYDSPQILLDNHSSMFYHLYKKSI